MPIFKMATIVLALLVFSCSSPSPSTHVTISNTQWHINGSITHPGTPAEGLLMNVRMVNATFEDTTISFNADSNTQHFIDAIPQYKKLGVDAFTLNLQGGMPGYEGAVNSAFLPDGSLQPDYVQRIARVIRACNANGMAVILGLFYQRQDQILADSTAVKTAVVQAIDWITTQQFKHVVVEIANEYPHPGFDHEKISSPEHMAELIQLAKRINPDLLVSASGLGNGKLDSLVAEASDFLFIHFNGTPVDSIPARIQALTHFNKPIVCNEDNKTGERACEAMRAAVRHQCSYGYMNVEVNQHKPFTFNGAADDPIFYECLQQLIKSSN